MIGVKKSPAFRCTAPYEYAYQGDVRKRPCDKCPGCIARMKRDLVARAAAEAVVSAEVVIFTLTYAPGHAGAFDFVVKDVSDFLKRERSRQWELARRRLDLPFRPPKGKAAEHRAAINAEVAKIVYFGVGERGSRGTRRCHWHLILFYSKPSGIEPSPRDDKGRLVRELRKSPEAGGDALSKPPFWNYGFVTVDVAADFSQWGRVAAARYVAKYVDKTRGYTRDARLSGKQREVVRLGSKGRAFGSTYIESEAIRTAQAGLPYRGKFYVEGVAQSKTGKLFKNSVGGVIRHHAAAAYKAEYQRLHPGKKIPWTDFLYLFDEEYSEDEYTRAAPKPMKWLRTAEPPAPLPPARDPAMDGWFALSSPGIGNVGVVRMYATGTARFVPKSGGRPVWLPAGDLSGVLPDLSPEQRAAVERWLSARRPVGWLSPLHRKAEEQRRAAAQEAAMAKLAPRHPKIAAAHVEGLEPLTEFRRGLMKREASGQKPGWSAPRRGFKPRPISKVEP